MEFNDEYRAEIKERMNKLKVVNSALAKDHICALNLTGEEFDNSYKNALLGRPIKNIVIQAILSARQRSHQMVIRYRELPIFDPYWKVIDCATFDFLKRNPISAYITLLSVVEAVCWKWKEIETGKGTGSQKEVVEFLRQKCNNQRAELRANEHWDDSLIVQWNYETFGFLENVLKTIYQSNEPFFNRNAVFHYLNNLKSKNPLNDHAEAFCKLLLILDVMAAMYFWEYHDVFVGDPKYKDTDIQDMPFASTYNQKLQDDYEEFYLSCFKEQINHAPVLYSNFLGIKS